MRMRVTSPMLMTVMIMIMTMMSLSTMLVTGIFSSNSRNR